MGPSPKLCPRVRPRRVGPVLRDPSPEGVRAAAYAGCMSGNYRGSLSTSNPMMATPRTARTGPHQCMGTKKKAAHEGQSVGTLPTVGTLTSSRARRKLRVARLTL